MITYILYCILIVCILSSLIQKENNKKSSDGRKDTGKRVHETVTLRDTNYDRNKDDRNASALCPHHVKWCGFFSTNFMILLFMLDTFQVFPKYYFNKICFQLPQNVTWTDELRA